MDNGLSSTFTPTPITKEQWQEKYWFTPLQMVTVINPAWYRENGQGEPVSRDYPFMVEMRHFIILAGKTEKLPGVIANVYLDQMSKIMAQNDEKLSYMSDPALMKLYYDKLIVEVEDLAPKYDPTPSYLRGVAPGVRADAPDERAPWEAKTPEAQKPAEPAKEEPKADETRQFDYQGNTYKMVTNKNGYKQFYKNGIYCTSAEYNKAASML